MKILSLFDGMSCGAIAMINAGIEMESYDAYEIDKYAIKTSHHNFPAIKHHGDVFKADFTQYENVDYLVGGSPCTYWSIAQKNNRETEASGLGWELFSQYLRALHEAKPRYFIYENNKSMSKEIRSSIDRAFGFEAVGINSALVSAQNRQRLYWVGSRNADGTYSKVEVKQPEDKGILLKDVLEYGESLQGEKGYCLTASYNRACAWNTIERSRRSMVAEPVEHGNPRYLLKNFKTDDEKANTLTASCYKGIGSDGMITIADPVCVAERGRYENGVIQQHFEAREDGKTNTLTRVSKDNNAAEPVCLRHERTEEAKRVRKQYEAGEVHHGFNELRTLQPRLDGKTNTISTVQKDNMIAEPVRVGNNGGGQGAKTGLYAIPVPYQCAELSKEYPVYQVLNGQITIKDKQYPIKLQDGYYIIRKLTVTECKRLQTVPEWYDFSVVSDCQAYKMLGNGWTCDVITHLINATKQEKKNAEIHKSRKNH